MNKNTDDDMIITKQDIDNMSHGRNDLVDPAKVFYIQREYLTWLGDDTSATQTIREFKESLIGKDISDNVMTDEELSGIEMVEKTLHDGTVIRLAKRIGLTPEQKELERNARADLRRIRMEALKRFIELGGVRIKPVSEDVRDEIKKYLEDENTKRQNNWEELELDSKIKEAKEILGRLTLYSREKYDT